MTVSPLWCQKITEYQIIKAGRVDLLRVTVCVFVVLFMSLVSSLVSSLVTSLVCSLANHQDKQTQLLRHDDQTD